MHHSPIQYFSPLYPKRQKLEMPLSDGVGMEENLHSTSLVSHGTLVRPGQNIKKAKTFFTLATRPARQNFIFRVKVWH